VNTCPQKTRKSRESFMREKATQQPYSYNWADAGAHQTNFTSPHSI